MAILTTTDQGLSYSGSSAFIKTGSDTVMTLTTSGEVGIGTTSPATKLHVGTSTLGTSPDTNADIISSGGITIDDNRRLSFDTNYYVHGNIMYNTSGTSEAKLEYQGYYGHNFITRSSTSAMVIKGDTGNVGIGTTSPSEKLDVVGTGTQLGTSAYYYNTRIKDATNSGVLFGGNNTNNGIGFVAGINQLAFLTYGTDWGERMRINGSGNVGIGNTNPTSKLAVAGNIQSTAGGSWGSNSGGVQLTFDGTDTGTVSMYYDNHDLVLGAGVTQKNGITISGQTSDNRITFRVANSERMRIDSNGDVAIGSTSTQGAKLRLYGVNGGGWNDGLIIDDPSGWAATVYKRSNSPKMFTGLYNGNDNFIWMATPYDNTGTTITAPRTDAVLMARPSTDDLQIYLETHFGGNVGIGTNNPDKKLVVSGTDSEIVINDTSYTPLLRFRNAGSTSGYIQMNSSEHMQIHTGGTSEAVRIQANGNVGIGTTSPSTELDVAGDISADGVITTGGTATAEVGSWLHVGRQWSFSGLPFFNKTSGSTAQRLDGAFMTDLNTGSAASRRAQAVFGAAFNDISGYSGAGTDYSRALGASIKAGFFITGQDSAKVIFAVGLASTSGVYADADPISNYGFGVEFRRGSGSVYEWRVFGHNGTTLTASSWSSSGITYSTDPRTIAIYSDGSGNITAYTAMYGNTNYTTITTTGGPTATSGTSTSTNMVGLRCNTNASGYVTGAYSKARASAVNFYAE